MCLFYFSCENTITNSSDILDCNNIPNGSASIDDCGDCDGGTDGGDDGGAGGCDGVEVCLSIDDGDPTGLVYQSTADIAGFQLEIISNDN